VSGEQSIEEARAVFEKAMDLHPACPLPLKWETYPNSHRKRAFITDSTGVIVARNVPRAVAQMIVRAVNGRAAALAALASAGGEERT
jgi:hypothetical protein